MLFLTCHVEQDERLTCFSVDKYKCAGVSYNEIFIIVPDTIWKYLVEKLGVYENPWLIDSFLLSTLK